MSDHYNRRSMIRQFYVVGTPVSCKLVCFITQQEVDIEEQNALAYCVAKL